MIRNRIAAPWLALCLSLSQFAAAQPAQITEPGARLQAFASEAELQDFLKPITAYRRDILEQQRLREAEAQRLLDEDKRRWQALHPGQTYVPPPPAVMLESVAITGGAIGTITNNQSAGVDEGGIVKLHGKHLVVLRRGRLFTVDVAEHTLKPVSSIDAFAPGVDPNGTWIDEMLIADDTIAVVCYSYQRGGTEVSLFNIDGEGRLKYRTTWQLRSGDYFSSRNYASRLVGNKLVFYAPLRISAWSDLAAQLPAMRRGVGDTGQRTFERIAPATHLYRHVELPDKIDGITLHTVVTCDIQEAEPDCQATALFGPRSRVFYVSPSAVYLWTTPQHVPGQSQTEPSSVYRMPLDGSAPSALRAAGAPIDQFSFLEQDGHLQVLLRERGRGDGMWQAETRHGAQRLSLLRVPLSDFGLGQKPVDVGRYRALPTLSSDSDCSLQNRFVGQQLLYGLGCPWRGSRPFNGTLTIVPFASAPSPLTSLQLEHDVDRIEALGNDAVVIGPNGPNLVFSSVRLHGAKPAIASRHVQADASQGETRSHGFFYRTQGEHTGLLGLPLRGAEEPGYQQLSQGSVAILFLRSDHLRFTPLGQLTSQPARNDDGCRASCVDWYGNARPIFLGDRLFALMGYELVEGRSLKRNGREQLIEMRRVNLQHQTTSSGS